MQEKWASGILALFSALQAQRWSGRRADRPLGSDLCTSWGSTPSFSSHRAQPLLLPSPHTAHSCLLRPSKLSTCPGLCSPARHVPRSPGHLQWDINSPETSESPPSLTQPALLPSFSILVLVGCASVLLLMQASGYGHFCRFSGFHHLPRTAASSSAARTFPFPRSSSRPPPPGPDGSAPAPWVFISTPSTLLPSPLPPPSPHSQDWSWTTYHWSSPKSSIQVKLNVGLLRSSPQLLIHHLHLTLPGQLCSVHEHFLALPPPHPNPFTSPLPPAYGQAPKPLWSWAASLV